jgi:hypothetical protein
LPAGAGFKQVVVVKLAGPRLCRHGRRNGPHLQRFIPPSQVSEDACVNRCNGRGTCYQGFCKCQAGWFGKDCSRSKAWAVDEKRPPK